MNARELMELLQRLPSDKLELPVHHSDGSYLGSTALVRYIEVIPEYSIAGPPKILLR